MKRQLLLLLTGLALLWNTSSYADDGTLGFGGGFNPNPHNLSVNSSSGANIATSETQICIFCHTPHGATPKSTLWSRPDPTGPMGGFPFRTLTSPNKIDDAGIVGTTHYSAATSAAEGYPNGTSKLCLSCHDGVTAMGILASGDTIAMTGNGLTTVGIDLSTSHPISFIYTAAVVTYLAGTYKLPAAGYLEIDNTDPNITRVQCTSCHQPHQNTRVVPGNSLPFWHDTTTADTNTAYTNVCNQCHTTTPSPPTIPNNHNF